MVTGIFCIGVSLSVAQGQSQAQSQLFKISDLNSRCGTGAATTVPPGRDHEIANLTINYPDGIVTDGFRILDGNQQRLVRWSEITSLQMEALVGDGERDKYVRCSVQFSDATRQTLHCLDGIVLGNTSSGVYKKPLDQVTTLIPPK
jgi:hypothetical protein